MPKVKRSQIQTFLNTTPLAAATYSLIGDGVKTGKIDMGVKTTEEVYVHQDSASVTVDSYAPSMAVEQICNNGDPVFEFIDALRKARAVLDAAQTDIVNVWMYETGGPTAYPAEKQTVVISISDFGGDGGQPSKIGYTIHYCGDPVPGTFNASSKAFTPS